MGLLRATGRPPSDLWAERTEPRHVARPVVLDRPRDELYARIDTRVDAMLDAGLLEENRQLLDRGLRLDRNPIRTIGYAEVIAHLEGRIDAAEMVRLVKRNTRRYAKRQLTWLRRRDLPLDRRRDGHAGVGARTVSVTGETPQDGPRRPTRWRSLQRRPLPSPRSADT